LGQHFCCSASRRCWRAILARADPRVDARRQLRRHNGKYFSEETIGEIGTKQRRDSLPASRRESAAWLRNRREARFCAAAAALLEDGDRA